MEVREISDEETYRGAVEEGLGYVVLVVQAGVDNYGNSGKWR